jgi:hypothetical protein
MTTKDYLNQISRLNRMINNKLIELAQLKELACSISSITNEERVMTTPNFDRIGAKQAKIDEMERNDYIIKRDQIVSQIDSMEDENVYNVLFSKYIEKKTFEVIATEMNYSWRQTIRLHGIALKKFEQKYGATYL